MYFMAKRTADEGPVPAVASSARRPTEACNWSRLCSCSPIRRAIARFALTSTSESVSNPDLVHSRRRSELSGGACSHRESCGSLLVVVEQPREVEASADRPDVTAGRRDRRRSAALSERDIAHRLMKLGRVVSDRPLAAGGTPTNDELNDHLGPFLENCQALRERIPRYGRIARDCQVV